MQIQFAFAFVVFSNAFANTNANCICICRFFEVQLQMQMQIAFVFAFVVVIVLIQNLQHNMVPKSRKQKHKIILQSTTKSPEGKTRVSCTTLLNFFLLMIQKQVRPKTRTTLLNEIFRRGIR